MKRDMDLCRQILLAVEAADRHALRSGSLEIEGFDQDAIKYNAMLLVQAELIEGKVIESISSRIPSAMLSNLSWEGHEFLDAVRSDTVWAGTKEKLAKVGGSVTIGTITEVASAVAKTLLMIG